jgi:bacterioferritin
MNRNGVLERIVSNLNVNLSWEYAAMIQYIQHAAMLNGAEYFAVIKELEEHSKDEHEHALIVSDLIQYLGGIPTLHVEKRLESLDNREMLLQDLQYEYDTIGRYLQTIHDLESIGLYDSSQKIRDIRVQEQHHAIELEKALGIQRTRPAIPHLQTVYRSV